MAMIILIAGEKGGCGKSTLATLLAIEHANKGNNVLLVDGDPQGSASNWIARRKDADFEHCPDVIKVATDEFKDKLPPLVGDYDHIIIDVAGRDSAELRMGVQVADLALFPLGITMMELETAHRMDAMIGDMVTGNSRLQGCGFIFSKVSTNHKKRAADIEQGAEFLSDCKHIGLTTNVISYRSAYERASIEGKTVSELRPRDPRAEEELTALLNEVFGK